MVFVSISCAQPFNGITHRVNNYFIITSCGYSCFDNMFLRSVLYITLIATTFLTFVVLSDQFTSHSRTVSYYNVKWGDWKNCIFKLSSLLIPPETSLMWCDVQSSKMSKRQCSAIGEVHIFPIFTFGAHWKTNITLFTTN